MENIKTKLKYIALYTSPYVDILNKILNEPTQKAMIQIPIKDSIPDIIKTPIVFISLCSFLMIILFTYANTIIFGIIGIVYPIICNINYLEENSADKIKLMNKYWILFSTMIWVEYLFSFVLDAIPFYRVIKIFGVYFLTCNNFMFSDKSYDVCRELFMLMVGKIKKLKDN